MSVLFVLAPPRHFRMFDLEAGRWTILPDPDVGFQHPPQLVAVGDYVFAIGDGTTLRFDRADQTWSFDPSDTTPQLCGHAFAFNNKLYLRARASLFATQIDNPWWQPVHF